ncbi:MAG TPA: hypothetical protein VFV75_06195, partial [Candidatus Polarisedimenticolaceae bacterium]|nr:hypothetical protein [Candidatus Polarisedimenticolaceae bacterium]
TSTGANVPLPGDLLAVWTGHEMIAWGAYRRHFDAPVQITGGRFDPASNTWVSVAHDQNTPIARIGATAVWTGREMLVWGGLSLPDNAYLNTGGRYDPVLDQWLPTSSTGMLPPPRRYAHTAIWTGTEMIVWGGDGLNGELQDGFRYDPASSRWSATSIGADVPPARTGHLAVWTGNEMIVWGDAFGWTAIGGCYCGLSAPDPGPLPRGEGVRLFRKR